MLSVPTHATSLSSFASVIEAAEREGLGVINGEPRAVPLVSGEYPREPAFFFSCDAAYFQGLCIPLLASISEHSPGIRCHVHLIDANERSEALAKPLPINLTFTHESSGLLQAPKQDRWNYYNAIRFVRFAEALRVNPGPLWISDVDALVTQDIRPMLLTRSELAFRMRPGRSALNEQVSACLALGTPASQNFFDHVCRFILTNPPTWGVDQVALFSALVALRPNVDLLGPDVAGVEADKPGTFWFTAGAAKLSLIKDETPYAREFRRVASNYLRLRG